MTTIFLDITLTVLRNGSCRYDIFDRRDAFGFKIVKFPHRLSAAPDMYLRAVAFSQLVRFWRLSNSRLPFIQATRKLRSIVIDLCNRPQSQPV